MPLRFYLPKTAELWSSLLFTIIAAGLGVMALSLGGDWRMGAIFALVLLGQLLFSRKFGERFVKPLIEINAGEISIRNPFNLPTTLVRIPVDELIAIGIAGPKGRRYIRYELCGKPPTDIGPYYINNLHLEIQLLDWLSAGLPLTVRVYRNDPPTAFDEIRGDY